MPRKKRVSSVTQVGDAPKPVTMARPYDKTPSLETLTRIARATKEGGKGEGLTAKDYNRAKKQVKKLKKANRKSLNDMLMGR